MQALDRELQKPTKSAAPLLFRSFAGSPGPATAGAATARRGWGPLASLATAVLPLLGLDGTHNGLPSPWPALAP